MDSYLAVRYSLFITELLLWPAESIFESEVVRASALGLKVCSIWLEAGSEEC